MHLGKFLWLLCTNAKLLHHFIARDYIIYIYVVLHLFCCRCICFMKMMFYGALSKNGLDIIPNSSLENQEICMLLSVTFPSISFSHRNLVTSRSPRCSPTCRNVFSMSAIIPILFFLNFSSKTQRSSNFTEPRCRHSLRLFIFLFVFAHASYTTRTLVVLFSSVVIA